MVWWQKPRVFRERGLWCMTAAGVPKTRHLRWEHAMEEVHRWWER